MQDFGKSAMKIGNRWYNLVAIMKPVCEFQCQIILTEDDRNTLEVILNEYREVFEQKPFKDEGRTDFYIKLEDDKPCIKTGIAGAAPPAQRTGQAILDTTNF